MTDKGAGRLGYKADPNGSRIFPFYQVEGYRTPEEARAILKAVKNPSKVDQDMLAELERNLVDS